ncbi:MAG: epsF 1 [Acidobacteria bacterium]|nr:epsF 1 [Acidobacteriota bacterium]
MPKLIQSRTVEFRCRLASPNGEIVEGVYIADSEARLRHELEEKGLFVLSLQPKHAIAGVSLQLPQRRSINTREFLVFNQELATLLKAGMPLVQSLDLLKRRVTAPAFRRVLDDVHDKVRSGTALSDAFGVHQALFPRVYTASLLAGERSGNLDAMLRRYVEYTKIIATVKRKTVSALVYPAILISLAIVLVTIIVLKVVPAFSDFYGTFGAELPLSTKLIVRFSEFLRSQFLLVIGGLVAGVIAVVAWIRQPGQQSRFDHMVLRLPMLGQVAKKFATSQMARTLATLLGGGLPLVNALDIAAKSVGNQYMAAQLDIVSARVREGESFAHALEARHVFPEVAVKMAEVGESTGALQDMLNTVADFYDEEIATTMDRFVTLVEPVLLVVMGIVIAGLLLALYMPLFQLSSVLAG